MTLVLLVPLLLFQLMVATVILKVQAIFDYWKFHFCCDFLKKKVASPETLYNSKKKIAILVVENQLLRLTADAAASAVDNNEFVGDSDLDADAADVDVDDDENSARADTSFHGCVDAALAVAVSIFEYSVPFLNYEGSAVLFLQHLQWW